MRTVLWITLSSSGAVFVYYSDLIYQCQSTPQQLQHNDSSPTSPLPWLNRQSQLLIPSTSGWMPSQRNMQVIVNINHASCLQLINYQYRMNCHQTFRTKNNFIKASLKTHFKEAFDQVSQDVFVFILSCNICNFNSSQDLIHIALDLRVIMSI